MTCNARRCDNEVDPEDGGLISPAGLFCKNHWLSYCGPDGPVVNAHAKEMERLRSLRESNHALEEYGIK